MIASLYSLLCRHRSPTADDLLLEAASLGDGVERAAAVEALLHRNTPRGQAGLLSLFSTLSVPQQRRLAEIGDTLAAAAARCARSGVESARASTAAFIAAACSPRHTDVLGDLLRAGSPEVFDAACEAAARLADWINRTAGDLRAGRLEGTAGDSAWRRLVELRTGLAAAVVRALDGPRGQDSAALAKAAFILLEDRRGLLFEAFIRGATHGWTLVFQRLTRPAESQAALCLLGCAARGGTLRQELSVALSSIDRTEILGGLLAHTHCLAEPALASAAGQIAAEGWRAVLAEMCNAASAADAIEWMTHSSRAAGAAITETLDRILTLTSGNAAARARLLRSAQALDSGAAVVQLLAALLADPDERTARMAARALARSGAGAAEIALIRHAPEAPASVRAIISRGVGARSFATFWDRFETLPAEARIAAGQALLKLDPETLTRLKVRLMAGPIGQRIKAMCIAAELGVAQRVRDAICAGCAHADPKLRSKAILMLGEVLHADAATGGAGTDAQAERLLEAALDDADARVRANGIEVLERLGRRELAALLEARSRLGRNRERANAIKALLSLRICDPERPLFEMLRDGRDAHRLSALWAVEQTRQWKLLEEVVRLARTDENLSVRRSAVATVQRMATQMRRPAA